MSGAPQPKAVTLSGDDRTLMQIIDLAQDGLAYRSTPNRAIEKIVQLIADDREDLMDNIGGLYCGFCGIQ